MYNLEIYNVSYKYNNLDIMASTRLLYSYLKFTDMLLFTMCVFMCIKTSNTEVSDPEGSSPCVTY
jgi:hypothetical protein